MLRPGPSRQRTGARACPAPRQSHHLPGSGPEGWRYLAVSLPPKGQHGLGGASVVASFPSVVPSIRGVRRLTE
eukprot:6189165-Lingulodinium_polyedra.AAC.1